MILLEELKKLGLQKNQYAIFGSGPLVIRALRETQNLDLIVKKPLWDELSKKYPKKTEQCLQISEHIQAWEDWKPRNCEINQLIDEADYIEGARFVKLKRVMEWKMARGTEKDLTDIKLIEGYFAKIAKKGRYVMKPLFQERMQKLMPEAEDFAAFDKIIHIPPKNFIRCNTLKMSPEKLLERLLKKWEVIQPYKENPEIMLVTSKLLPGELGSSIEHLSGYYYIQEVCSMMSAIALDPKEGEFILDVCASPGSKTTQIAAKMNNKGTLFANDLKVDRIRILNSNLERCGVSNIIVSKNDGVGLCERFLEKGIRFDKILLDVPCSGEGTLRSSPKTFEMWNHKVVNSLSRQQKKLFASAIKCLKEGGTLVYSTCTHAPEEDESVIDFGLRNFPIELEQVSLPLKFRPGLTSWEGETYNESVKKCARIYPQDNDSEGFFVAKCILKKEILK